MDGLKFAGMPVGPPLLAFFLFNWSGCADKEPPELSPEKTVVKEESNPPTDTLPDSGIHPDSLPEIITSPPAAAFTGHPYAYAPGLSRPYDDTEDSGAISWKLIEGPEGMGFKGGRIHWTPKLEGRFSVTLVAVSDIWASLPDTLRPSQTFSITVSPLPDAKLAPIPSRVISGNPVTFDLDPSGYPAWAWPHLQVRFDFEGDGVWDTPLLPFRQSRSHSHVYEKAGRMAPRVMVVFRNTEERLTSADFLVATPPKAVLALADTLEPGRTLTWDASASTGRGSMKYRLDLNGDGTWDAMDSLTGKFTLPSPPSGKYRAILEVRDESGLTGRVEKSYVANSPPGIKIKTDADKANLVTPVTIQVRAFDSDDDFTLLRFNLTGADNDWKEQAPVADSTGAKNRLDLEWKRTFGKPGIYSPQVCAQSADGRTVCAGAKVEVYDAPPVCSAGPPIRATLGAPVSLTPTADDPDGKIIKWEWDLDGDKNFEYVSEDSGNLRYTFAREGKFTLTLQVTSSDGRTATSQTPVEVKKKWKP